MAAYHICATLLICVCVVVQVHDRMTEQVYPAPLQSFRTDTVPTPVFTVPVMAQGAAALQQINEVCVSHCSCCIRLESSVLLV